MNWKWIIVLALMLLLVIFAVQNYEIVEIRFLLWTLKTSRAIIVFGTFLIGLAVGWIIRAVSLRHGD
jgi:uncharacterized integral membrane protein